MPNKVYLLLCFHNHQPVGNFDHVIEEAYEKSYLPFLRMLASYPEVRVTLHYSGFLMEWLKERKEDFMALLTRLVERRQVEILGGGMYEPVLPLLPERDRIGQLDALGKAVRENFGRKPRGIWLAERVWEPELPVTLKKAKVQYLPLDDHHFTRAGLSRDNLNGYFITEYNAFSVKVFPGLEKLRYTIPFKDPWETLNFLKTLQADPAPYPAAMFADDGEKFGSWPGTYQLVHENGWLEEFFRQVVAESKWLRTASLGEYVDMAPARGRVYLPATSYPEMGEWALPPERAKGFGILLKEKRGKRLGDAGDFIEGGHFRNFLAKYEESNQMHKRMLFVSERVEKARKVAGQAESRPMVDRLYRAQNNDSFWHGVFGGLYLPHLRDSFYRNLLEAEKLADGILKRGKKHSTEVLRGDINRDGAEEVILKSPGITMVVHPEDGGSVSELSFLERNFNALNVLTRREESYHAELMARAVEAGGGKAESIHDSTELKKGVSVGPIKLDSQSLRSFNDRLFEGTVTPADILTGSSNLAFSSQGKAGRPSCMMSEERGAVRIDLAGDVKGQQLELEKTIHLESKRDEVKTRFRLTNKGDGTFSLTYCQTWYLNFLAPQAEDRSFISFPSKVEEERIGSEGSVSGVTAFGIRDGWQGFSMVFEGGEEFDVAYSPIETLSLSEAGGEKIYQGSEISFLFTVELSPGATREVDMRIAIESIA